MPDPVMESVVARPSAALAGLVDGYVGYRIRGFEPGLHRGMPSRHLTFIVALDAPVDVDGPGGTGGPASFGVPLAGLHESAATIRHDGNQHGIHVNLRPEAARALFGLPAGELASDVVEAAECIGPIADELAERVAAAAGWRERFAVVDEVLLGLLADRPPPPPEVFEAWARILRSGGRVSVGDLAREVGWSRRHLHHRFRTELGLAPKAASRVIRFERAKRLLERADRPPLAEVAHSCGYYDQAHFTNEWREIVGLTPLGWLAEDLPSVQNGAVVLGR